MMTKCSKIRLQVSVLRTNGSLLLFFVVVVFVCLFFYENLQFDKYKFASHLGLFCLL